MSIKQAVSAMLRNPMFWVAVVYLLFPVDFLPDVAPVVGTLDDLLVFIVSTVVQSKLSTRIK